MSIENRNKRFLPLIPAVIFIVIDQLLKIWVIRSLMPIGRFEVISGLFYLTYVENRGAAFGILQGKTVLLAGLTGVVLIALAVLILSGKLNRFLNRSLTLVLAGGVGNLFDRLVRGYVVDYLDFSAIFGFPVFNFADCCVVVGTVLVLCAIVWSDLPKRQAQTPTEGGSEA